MVDTNSRAWKNHQVSFLVLDLKYFHLAIVEGLLYQLESPGLSTALLSPCIPGFPTVSDYAASGHNLRNSFPGLAGPPQLEQKSHRFLYVAVNVELAKKTH